MTFWFHSHLFRAAALAALVLGSAASPTCAAPVVDQSYLYPTNINLPGHPISATQGSYTEAAQTFTVGLDGLLTSVQVQIAGEVQRTVTLDIRPLSSGVPTVNNASALASFTVTSPQWAFGTAHYPITTVDVSSAGLFVEAGDLLAITIRTASASWGGWAEQYQPAPGYAGGQSYFRGGPGASWGTYGSDLGFATYVDPSIQPVPEPASFALLGAALLGIAGLRRRRC